MNALTLSASVGKNASNQPKDIKLIQALINVYYRSLPTKSRLIINGQISDGLQYQLNLLDEQLHPIRPVRLGAKIPYHIKSDCTVFAYLKNTLNRVFQSKPITPPTKGRLTFEAEGQEGGRYHSRRLHVPSLYSGLTLGRGYDMKYRSAASIIKDLNRAGIKGAVAQSLSKASGLSGKKAEQFIIDQDLLDFQITPKEQLALFKGVYEEYVAKAKRVCIDPEIIQNYGACDWDKLSSKIKTVLVDMAYRGDYYKPTQKFLQKAIVNSNVDEFKRAMDNPKSWAGANRTIPTDRQRRRLDFLSKN